MLQKSKLTNFVSVTKDGITSAHCEAQREIQLAAHDIYEALIQGLLDTHCSERLNQGNGFDILMVPVGI